MSIFKDKVLLITGGIGNFGNAVLRRFLDSDIKENCIFSRDKKQVDMRHALQNPKVKFYIGNVRGKGFPLPNYTDENVSTKVVKLIQSYTGVVNKKVWRKYPIVINLC